MFHAVCHQILCFRDLAIENVLSCTLYELWSLWIPIVCKRTKTHNSSCWNHHLHHHPSSRLRMPSNLPPRPWKFNSSSMLKYWHSMRSTTLGTEKKHHHTTVEVEISLNVEKMHPFQFFGWKKLTSWNYNLDQNWLLVPIAPNVVFMNGQVSEHMWTWIFQPHPSRFLLRSRIIDTLDSIRLPDDVQNNRYLESINLPGEGQLSYRVLVGQS